MKFALFKFCCKANAFQIFFFLSRSRDDDDFRYRNNKLFVFEKIDSNVNFVFVSMMSDFARNDVDMIKKNFFFFDRFQKFDFDQFDRKIIDRDHSNYDLLYLWNSIVFE